MAAKKEFPERGKAYLNAYFIFIDASGHSKIVGSHHHRVASEAFNLVFDRVSFRIKSSAATLGCETAFMWGWQGDGGLWLLHDTKNDDRAHDAALRSAQEIVAIELPYLQAEFSNRKLPELHLRIAIHSGSFSGTGAENRGLVHSEDINFAAHLEKVAPKDALAVSGSVFKKIDRKLTGEFVHVGKFEDYDDVYLWSRKLAPQQLLNAWIQKVGIAEPLSLYGYPGRPSPSQKAAMIRAAQNTFIDIGTTMRTCAASLLTREGGDAPYRNAVMGLLGSGAKVRCYMLDPKGKLVKQFRPDPRENTGKIAQTSFDDLQRFKASRAGQPGEFELLTYDFNPGYAAMAIDLEEPDGIILFSPYLTPPDGEDPQERKDMPHYLVSSKTSPALFGRLKTHIARLISKARPQ